MTQCVCCRWAVDLSTWSPTLLQLTKAVAAVQPEERKRLMKFHFIDDFLSSLVGRLLMRKFVSESTGINYHEVKFSRDRRGKPFLDMEADTQQVSHTSFNVSHQGDFVVLAGVITQGDDTSNSTDFGVGVDVMKLEYSGGKDLTEFFRLMNRKFADNEWRYINRAQHNTFDKLKAFMRHWCLKESYVKELGVGITIDLQKISFSVDPDAELCMESTPLTNTTLRCYDVPMTDWHFEEHLLHPKYCAAISFRNCYPARGYFEILKIEDLLMQQNSDDDDIIVYCKNVLKKQKRT